MPSHWVLHGQTARYGRPQYTNVQFPFPIDPPHVPDENPVGDYRRTFDRPDWDVARVLLRFDGVESVYRVVLNGTEVGVGKGSRLVQEFDVTEPARRRPQRARRAGAPVVVHELRRGPGPVVAARDLPRRHPARPAARPAWTTCGCAPGTPRAAARSTRRSPATFPVTLAIPELGVQRRFATAADLAAVDVGPVQPWTAETPRLYDATVTSPGETVSLRLGFRTVAIEGARFTVNGRPVTFRGMNRHETHPERGRVFDEAHARADLLAMKRHNVNAIRTSHYPPHHRVLELADELGFWVVLENDLETHGFVDIGWRGNPSDDPAWEAVYLDRIARTVERDKNHACVVLWSLGNEAGTGRNLAATAQWVRRRDPGRPVHYEGDRDRRLHRRLLADVPLAGRGRGDLRGLGRHPRPLGGGDAAGAEPAVPDVRVRARHGQRPRRARHLRRAGRREPAPPRRVRLGVARPRDPHAHRRRHALLRLRRRLRRGRARRQLRHGRHGAARRHPDARAGGVRGGERAGRPDRRRDLADGHQPPPLVVDRAPAVRRGGRGRRRAAVRGRDRGPRGARGRLARRSTCPAWERRADTPRPG